MTEATAVPKDQATTTIAMTAATMGHDLVAMLLAELRSMPAHWATIDAARQQQIIENLKEKTRAAVEHALTFMLRSEFQAVPAKLTSVNRRGGIKAGLSVNADAQCRHALFDAEGQQVLIVICDPLKWFDRMDEIKARGDQLDLFNPEANYDPTIDQPGYRRDQDRLAPAGKTWAELRESFKTTEQGAESDPDADSAKAPPDPYAPAGCSSLTPEQELLTTQRIFQEQCAELGMMLSLGAIKARTAEEFDAALQWMAAYAADPIGCPVAKPEWLPARDVGDDAS